VATDFGLKPGTPISYRAGDQPNNAFSLNVLNPGEIAATAGTSGVVFGVSDQKQFDPESRVNSFLHVNHDAKKPRVGILHCVNGAGIMNAWMKRLLGDVSYTEMNRLSKSAPEGSAGLSVLPFGNGAERVFGDQVLRSHLFGIDFIRHDRAHVLRAIQEGIVFSLQFGMEVMGPMGVNRNMIRAGNANMFRSEIFSKTLADISGARIEIYDTDGALGAARGAGIGLGAYASFEEAFVMLKMRKTYVPEKSNAIYDAYLLWKERLFGLITTATGLNRKDP